MDTVGMAREKRLLFLGGLFLAAAVILLVGFLGTNVVGAQSSNSNRCHGTYFVDVVQSFSPESALWTFSKDGNFQASNSLEKDLNFSSQQGAWVYSGGRNAKAVWLSFSFYSLFFNAPGIGRNDADIVFSDDCQSLSGSFDLRFYDSTLNLDPLDPADGIFLGSATFSGRRLNP